MGLLDPWRRMACRYRAVSGAKQSLSGDGFETESLSRRARLVWARFMAFCYVDDAYGISELLGNRPHIFADCLRAAGGMLMGHGAWSISKVKEDGFYAWLHKFTGIVIDTRDAPKIYVSFTVDRVDKVMAILATVNLDNEYHPLGLVPSLFGNLMWFTKV